MGSQTTKRICAVPIEHLAFLWPQAEPHLEQALRRESFRRFLTSDVLPLLLDGKAQLWISWDDKRHEVEAAMVTEIIQYPRLKECRVWLIGGRNMKAWSAEFRDETEAYAVAHGCDIMGAGGRRGFARVGGYREIGVDLIKPLERMAAE